MFYLVHIVPLADVDHAADMLAGPHALDVDAATPPDGHSDDDASVLARFFYSRDSIVYGCPIPDHVQERIAEVLAARGRPANARETVTSEGDVEWTFANYPFCQSEKAELLKLVLNLLASAGWRLVHCGPLPAPGSQSGPPLVLKWRACWSAAQVSAEQVDLVDQRSAHEPQPLVRRNVRNAAGHAVCVSLDPHMPPSARVIVKLAGQSDCVPS